MPVNTWDKAEKLEFDADARVPPPVTAVLLEVKLAEDDWNARE